MGTLTTVVRVNGQNPQLWRADPQHLYVGRRVFLRSGIHKGQHWPNSALGNPYRVNTEDTLTERRRVLEMFERFLATDQYRLSQLGKMQGKVLGCWCCNWDGITQPRPLCHAAVYADWCNRMAKGERPWEAFL